MKTIEDRLAECKGFGPGFDMVRIVLSFTVMFWHGFWLFYGKKISEIEIGPVWIVVYAALPMFFALSGFLVTASALRLPLREFMLNRSLRIVPALGVDILLSALVLGPIFTVLSLTAYFSDPLFWSYFLNIVGSIHYFLPGVFESNPHPRVVNASLWTVPYEIACYVVMFLLILFGIIRRETWVFALCVGWLLAALAIDSLGLRTGFSFPDRLINFLVNGAGSRLVPFFLAGATIYMARKHVPYDRRVAGVACALVLVCAFSGSKGWQGPSLDLLLCFPLSYLVIWAGLTDLPKLPLFRRGDYSYGIYLYHFPILQALVATVPFTHWAQLNLVAFFVVSAFAMFSWHFIEKPVLRLRKHFSVVGARIAKEQS